MLALGNDDGIYYRHTISRVLKQPGKALPVTEISGSDKTTRPIRCDKLVVQSLPSFTVILAYEDSTMLRTDGIIGIVALSPLLLYSIIICTHSTLQNKSLRVGLLSVPAAFVQLMGYGCGFLSAWWKRCVLGQDEFQAYEKNFYK